MDLLVQLKVLVVLALDIADPTRHTVLHRKAAKVRIPPHRRHAQHHRRAQQSAQMERVERMGMGSLDTDVLSPDRLAAHHCKLEPYSSSCSYWIIANTLALRKNGVAPICTDEF